MANKLKLLPPMLLNDEDPSESRVRENRLHGLMRGGSETVIGLVPFNPSTPAYSTPGSQDLSRSDTVSIAGHLRKLTSHQ